MPGQRPGHFPSSLAAPLRAALQAPFRRLGSPGGGPAGGAAITSQPISQLLAGDDLYAVLGTQRKDESEGLTSDHDWCLIDRSAN